MNQLAIKEVRDLTQGQAEVWDDLIEWQLDTDKFESEYPRPFQKYTKWEESGDRFWPDTYEYILDLLIDEKVISSEDSVVKQFEKAMKGLSREIPKIEVLLHNDSRQVISNVALLQMNQSLEYDGHSIVSEGSFVYCIIHRVHGQAGSLGIWDTRARGWCFYYSDEQFCVKNIRYDGEKDQFLGSFFYHSYVTPYDEVDFVVNKDRKIYISAGTEINTTRQFSNPGRTKG